MSYFGIKRIVLVARHFLGILFVGCIVMFVPTQARAFIENNVRCDRSGGAESAQQLGTVSPGQDISFIFQIDCTVLRRFPVGLSLSYNATGPAVEAYSFYRPIPKGGPGTSSTVCVPYSCTSLPVGTRFQTAITMSGMAASQPGTYILLYNLFATSIGGWENYSEKIITGIVIYTVSQPACTLTSGSAVDLSFGALSSLNLSAESRTANIEFSCRSASRVTAKLTPTQGVVNSVAGISATTLSGLSMVSNWTDTGAAVNLGSARSLNFTTGSNTLGVRFQPLLNNLAVQPVGSFSSQYTLTITYL